MWDPPLLFYRYLLLENFAFKGFKDFEVSVIDNFFSFLDDGQVWANVFEFSVGVDIFEHIRYFG